MNILPDELLDKRTEAEDAQELPLLMDWAIDTDTGELMLRNGKPYMAEGLEALKIWIWKVLHTQRDLGDIYCGSIGNDFDELIGTPWRDAVDRLGSMIRDALMISDYITEVDKVSIEKTENGVRATVRVKSIYGDIETHQEVNI